MIREEKFNLLNELLRYEENNDIGNLTRAERREFQQWISKALEQEPCEDAISRQAVLEYIEGSEAELGHSSENELVCQDIKKLPSVTPKPCEEREQGKCPFYAN